MTRMNSICLVTNQASMKRPNTMSQLRVPPMYLIILASYIKARASATGKADHNGEGAYMHQKRTGSRTSHTSMRTMMRHPTLVKFQA